MDSTEFFKIIGRNIKQLRIERKIAQQDLAAACNFEKSNLARLEAGKTNPTVRTLFKISEELKVPISRLFELKDADK